MLNENPADISLAPPPREGRAANNNDSPLLAEGMLTAEGLAANIAEAEEFLKELRATATLGEKGLVATVVPEWAPRLLRRHGVAGAVVEKAGSRAYVKRRPEDPSAFIAYVEKQAQQQEPLLLRVGFGPLKNANHCPTPDPDWAEYLTLVQLARMMHGLAGVYPHGIRAEVVPDDVRTCSSNLCPKTCTTQYIKGLQAMVKGLSLEKAITIESGQQRLYAQYNVDAFRAAAEEALHHWRATEPEKFSARWETAVENARKNIYCAQNKTAGEIGAAAWRYMAAHRAEVLSGLWSPGDAFPLRYANHPNSYQAYTLGFKKTKLPWQISLPLSLLNKKSQEAGL